jgi:hypothetical protein
METDLLWLEQDHGRTLFALVIATPLLGGIPNERYSKLLEQHENLREADGVKSVYYTSVELHHDVVILEEL